MSSSPIKSPLVRVPIQPNQVPAPRRVAILPGARPGGTGVRVAGNPGGKLNVGALSRQGDLAGNWAGGRTPAGWAPGGDNGSGKGSGSGSGTGTPEPPKQAAEGPAARPAPAPPAPKTVSVRVCEASGMLAGDHCKRTRIQTFVDGTQADQSLRQVRGRVQIAHSRPREPGSCPRRAAFNTGLGGRGPERVCESGVYRNGRWRCLGC